MFCSNFSASGENHFACNLENILLGICFSLCGLTSLVLNSLLIYLISTLKVKQVNVLLIAVLGAGNLVTSVANWSSEFRQLHSIYANESGNNAGSMVSVAQCYLRSPHVVLLIVGHDWTAYVMLAMSIERMASLCGVHGRSPKPTQTAVRRALAAIAALGLFKLSVALADSLAQRDKLVHSLCNFRSIFSEPIYHMLLLSYLVMLYSTAAVFLVTCCLRRQRRHWPTSELLTMRLSRERSLTKSLTITLAFVVLFQALPWTLLYARLPTARWFRDFAIVARHLTCAIIPIIYLYNHPDIRKQLYDKIPLCGRLFKKQKRTNSVVYIGR
ncbi:hypothetical protein T12_2585 [Trichinella patagoniensis]|uniref:G-protein coupled receptors family 1 profile domain-containing protein n=1 Tax=Trichinella patagoniensis TaxID=990121 RepID=A0A0V0ZCS8_9BILA|nr:hypothetical protein T12_2585 [Trichinella patagoniensis]